MCNTHFKILGRPCCWCGKDLRSLSLQENDDMENDYMPDGKWLCELSLCNSVMESLDFHAPFNFFDVEDVERLAENCSNSLVSLDIFPRNLSSYRQVFKHAKKLHHFGIGIVHEDEDYSDVEFPSNIRALRIMELREASFPYLLPYLNQLRELDIECGDFPPNCLCFLIKRCPNLEVLVNQDKCGDEGLQVIAQFCKKLRKFNHREPVTHLGLITLAQGCPNLTHLNVRLLDTSNEVLECVGTHLKNLCDFRIWMGEEDATTDSLLDNGVRAMLVGCSKLEKLDIGLSIGGLTDVGLGYIGRYGNNLKYLSLCNTGDSDVGLLELSKGCLKLRKLRLRCCPFSEQAIATFLFNIHSLRYIRVARDHHPHLLLTRPMLSAEVLTKLYVKLAEKLHRLAVQLAEDGSDVESESVKITYVSSRPRATDDIDIPLVRDLVAKGIQKEEYDTVGESSETLLEIIVRIHNVESPFATAISEVGDIRLQGRVKDGVPHLSKLGAFEVDLRLDGHILLCRQGDEPSTISSVTNILEEEIISINSMSVGKPAPRKPTVMVIGMDEKPSDEALKKIGEIPAVEELVFLAL